MMTTIARIAAPVGAAFLFACLAMSASIGYAALFDLEQFNYAGGNLGGQNGGSGWNGAWAPTSATNVTVAATGGSLAYPVPWEVPGIAPPTAGSRVSYESATNASSFRLISNPINLSQDGNVLYVSALFKKTRTNGETTADNILLEFVDSSANRRFGVGIEGTGDRPWLNANGSTSPATTVTVGDTYFMVAKIVSSASGNDTASLWVYGTGYGTQVPLAEPAATITLTETTGAILDRIRVRIDNGNAVGTPGEVDEIRIGNSWSDVTTVPEPASLTLLCIAGLAASVRRRR